MAGRRTLSRASAPRVIETMADIDAALAVLTRSCPAMAAAHALVGAPPLRRWSPGFDGAAAILARLTAAVVPLDARSLALASDATLRAAGLSGAKIATLRALAAAVGSGAVDLDLVQTAPAERVRDHLMAVRGVGPWTADIYLLFCRGDMDAFAPGDLALQVGAARLLNLPERPTAAELGSLAERWRPWRGVAARLIWSYYGHLKAQDMKRVAARQAE
jgi:DNA-3-methyladenine glycosylase II